MGRKRKLKALKVLAATSLVCASFVHVKAQENVVNPVMSVTFDAENAADISGNGNHGSVVGEVSYVEGVKGKAIHIQNGDVSYTANEAIQYVNFHKPNDLQFATDDFSIAFWYKGNATQFTDGGVIGNKDWASGRNPGFMLGEYDDILTINFTANGADRADTGGKKIVNDNTWHHLAAVFDRSDKMSLYVDGKLSLSTDISSQEGKSIDAGEFILGADGYKKRGVENVMIDELQVFRDVLPETQIESMCDPVLLQGKVQKLRDKVTEYEQLVDSSNVSLEKKEAFMLVINEVKDKLETVTTSQQVEELDKKLQTAYANFGKPEKGKAEFVVVSDTHVQSSASSTTAKIFDDGLNKITTTMPDVKTVVNCGDFTSDGADSEYEQYYTILDKYDEKLQFINPLGNHDVRWTSYGWEGVRERYMSYNKKYMGDTDKVYYDTWIGEGEEKYHFIVINPEWDIKDASYITNEQLEWLDKTMAEGAEADKPIFVTLHQPLRNTIKYTDSYDGCEDYPNDEGPQDFALKEILRKYPQTVIFTGHVHNGLGTSEIVETEYGTLVDVPSYADPLTGILQIQLGYHVSVYDGKVQLSMYDFEHEKWLPDYYYTIDLRDEVLPGKVLDVNFDDNTANDTTGNGNNGKIVGNVEFVEGVHGKAVHIQNPETNTQAQQYIDFGNVEDLKFGKDDFTIMFWYKGTKEMDTEGAIISNKDWDSGSNLGFTIGTFTDPRPGIGLNFVTPGSTRDDTERYTRAIDGGWHHVGASFDRDGKMTLYIDGRIQESRDISAHAGSSVDVETLSFVLGADGKKQYPVNDAYIDELKVYKKVIGAYEFESIVPPYHVEPGENKVNITWEDLEDRFYPAYIIFNGEKLVPSENVTNYEISGLTPNTNYTIEIITRDKVYKNNLVFGHEIDFKTIGKDSINKAALKMAIDNALAITSADLDKVVPVVKEAFESALANAQTVYDNAGATQDDVNKAFMRLAKAMHMLEFVKGDKTALETLINEVKALNSNNYTVDSWEKLSKELSNAVTVYNDVNAMQKEVDETREALQAAKDALVKIEKPVEVDKSKLQAFYNQVKDIKANKYLPNTWTGFEKALNDASAILAKPEATQAEVDNAYNTLVKAYLDLRLIPNKEALEELINKAESLNDPKLAKAIAEAKAVVADENATEAQVKGAYATLEAAIKGLDAGDKVVANGDKAVATGDNNAIASMMALAGLSFAGLYLSKKRRFK